MGIEPLEIARGAYEAAIDTKATNPMVLDIGELSTVADYFLICSADNQVQVRAICERIERKLRDRKVRPLHVEGGRKSGWLLLDYGSVVVHVFVQELRDYYLLENLWGDAKSVDF